MVKDFKYIIKRILIGVGIALILSFLRYGFILNTHAKEISSIFNQIPAGNVQGVNNMTQYVNFNFNPGHWSNWGYGILRFNFSIIKVGGSSLAPLVVPSNVSATNFACDVSSTSTSNSTFTGSTYSASCPMIMGPNGLEFISIILTDNQQNEQGIYRITMGSLLTFEKIEDVTLDTSSTTSAINNQITNDNNNTQNIINNQNSNKQDIINNQNQNTQAIVNSQQDINNALNNDNVDSQQASDFFSNFQTDSHGLSGIITSPLRLIESLSSSQCSPLVLPLPFVNQSATIPCMSSVYSKFPTFYNLWQLISTGIIAYYILIKLFGHVKGMQNPNDDRIEVLNL